MLEPVAEEQAAQPGWVAVWRHLAAELRTTPAQFEVPGVHLAAAAPQPRPYFAATPALLVALYRRRTLVAAASPGFVGFAQSWLHHAGPPEAAMSVPVLRWVRQQLARGEARLQILEQYAIFRGDVPPRVDAVVRRLHHGDEPVLETELGWAPHEASEWVGRGVYAAFVGDRLACRVCTYDLGDGVAEVGVQTLAEFRRRGLATQAVQFAAANLLGDHEVVFYTCGQENEASKALAHHLHARRIGDLLVVLDQHQD